MLFDGAHLFGDKADSALERFKDNQGTVKSLGLAIPPPHSPFRPLQGFGRRGTPRPQYTPGQTQQSFRGRGQGSHRGRGKSQSAAHPPAPAANP